MTSLLLATIVAAAVSASGDTTVDVSPDAKLWLRNLHGMIQVATWDKSAVRVHAQPSYARAGVRIKQRGPSIMIEPMEPMPRDMEPSGYVFTVPAWMSVALVSPEASARVRGLKGSLVVRTVNGDVEVADNEGSVSVSSVQGPVRVVRARGRLQVSTVNGPITLDDVSGRVMAETVNGPIDLARVMADSVEASTVNGLVRFNGRFMNRGWYHFATHQGDIAVHLPSEPDAQVWVATYDGEFSSDFPVMAPFAKHADGLHFKLGDGKAMLQLESFRGHIWLSREGHEHRAPNAPVFKWPDTPHPPDDEEDSKP